MKTYQYKNAIWNIISKDANILYELKEYFENKFIHTVIYGDSRGCTLLSCTTKKFLEPIYHLLYDEATIYMERKKIKFSKMINELN